MLIFACTVDPWFGWKCWWLHLTDCCFNKISCLLCGLHSESQWVQQHLWSHMWTDQSALSDLLGEQCVLRYCQLLLAWYVFAWPLFRDDCMWVLSVIAMTKNKVFKHNYFLILPCQKSSNLMYGSTLQERQCGLGSLHNNHVIQFITQKSIESQWTRNTNKNIISGVMYWSRSGIASSLFIQWFPSSRINVVKRQAKTRRAKKDFFAEQWP